MSKQEHNSADEKDEQTNWIIRPVFYFSAVISLYFGTFATFGKALSVLDYYSIKKQMDYTNIQNKKAIILNKILINQKQNKKKTEFKMTQKTIYTEI